MNTNESKEYLDSENQEETALLESLKTAADGCIVMLQAAKYLAQYLDSGEDTFGLLTITF